MCIIWSADQIWSATAFFANIWMQIHNGQNEIGNMVKTQKQIFQIEGIVNYTALINFTALSQHQFFFFFTNLQHHPESGFLIIIITFLIITPSPCFPLNSTLHNARTTLSWLSCRIFARADLPLICWIKPPLIFSLKSPRFVEWNPPFCSLNSPTAPPTAYN